MTAAAPPPAAVLEALEKENFRVTHVYGLTEVYGPATICSWHEDWDALPEPRARAAEGAPGRALRRRGRRHGDGSRDHEGGAARRRDHGRGHVPRQSHHEGLPEEPQGDQGGVRARLVPFGDLGVLHEDGYIELRDRSKDIIISGGENISTIEVEGVIIKHPAVANVAVVAKPDEKWGETPCAFVVLKPGATATAEEIVAHCRANLASFKCPRYVVFRELPMTSTGKVQKFVLREWAKAV